MLPVELNRPRRGKRKTEYERTRDMHIRENMWKASHAARKVSQFSGLPFEDLRSVALEAMVKLYDKWDPSRANFSTWLNRALTYQVLNYLRDHSRMIKIPRSYSDVYMRIRRFIGENPDISDEKLAKKTKIPINLITETREAYKTTFLEINEETEMPVNNIKLDEDSIDKMYKDYGDIIEKIDQLSTTDFSFLCDVYVDKRANSTVSRRYQGANSPEKIRIKTKNILINVLREWPREDT